MFSRIMIACLLLVPILASAASQIDLLCLLQDGKTKQVNALWHEVGFGKNEKPGFFKSNSIPGNELDFSSVAYWYQAERVAD